MIMLLPNVRLNEIVKKYEIVDQIDVKCPSANQLQASAVPRFLREMLLMESEKGKTYECPGKSC